jgi:hypothetical protein
VPPFPGQTPRPSTVTSSLDVLRNIRGRVLLHVKATGQAPLGQVSRSTGGVVFSGANASKSCAEFVQDTDHGVPTIIDPALYENFEATPDLPMGDGNEPVPMDHPPSGTNGSEGDPRHLRLTPTRYLPCTDRGEVALRNAMAEGEREKDPALVLAVPIDVRWLVDRREDLLHILNATPAPKAIILCHKGNPMGSGGHAAGLREIFSRCENTALLRTDLAAFEAMVHGAAFASIGDRSSVRYSPLPGSHGWSKRNDRSPNVLHPTMLDYFRGSTLATYFRDVSHECTCPACSSWAEKNGRNSGGRHLSSFTDSADTYDAHAHNLATWSHLWDLISSQTSPERQRDYWRRMCANSVAAFEYLNDKHSGRIKAFKAPVHLRVWSDPDGRSGSAPDLQIPCGELSPERSD